MNLFCDDISFCPADDCKRTSCMRNQANIRDRTIPHSFFVETPPDCPKKKTEPIKPGTGEPEWVPADKLPSSISFLCPHCYATVHYYHGSTSKSRRKTATMKRCPYQFCPWCGKKVTPYRVNFIDYGGEEDGTQEG